MHYVSTVKINSNRSSLAVKQLSLSINHKKIIDGISFTLPIQKKVALVGLNGAGKSSLIRLLIGELFPEQGDIQFQNNSLTDLVFKDQLGYQASAMQSIDNITAKEYLNMCCLLKNISTAAINQRIKCVIEQWGLNEIVNIPMQRLSQGNVQKLALAQVFLNDPQYIILDEPTHSLDPYEQQRFIDNLNQLDNYQLCLFSSHHINETVEAADLVLMLHRGKKIALVDLKAINQLWFVSHLTELQIVDLVGYELSLEIIYSQKKNLYRLSCFDQLEVQRLTNQLAEIDPEIIVLGSGNQVLMPLFSLLANERL